MNCIPVYRISASNRKTLLHLKYVLNIFPSLLARFSGWPASKETSLTAEHLQLTALPSILQQGSQEYLHTQGRG